MCLLWWFLRWTEARKLLDGMRCLWMYFEGSINRTLTCTLSPRLQASVELAATYAALILADDGIEITVSPPVHSRCSNLRF